MYHAFISYSHAADGRMAPALQLALEKFAKPWYKIRNLDVFRDEASLSVSPHLWANIQRALDQAEYLIYMASPVSAASKWVNKEIEYWLAHKPLEKLLIVLTDGTLSWDDKNNTFLDPSNNSLPGILDRSFTQEPFYIDLRSLKTEEDLSLNNPIFKKEVLKLAAQLHGKAPKDMAGDEVIAHNKMIRVRNSAIGSLVLLLVAALVAAFMANKNANEARRQTTIARDSSLAAQQQRGIAEFQKRVAEDSAREARLQRNNAYIQQQIAIQEKNNAILQQQIAIKERNIAQANFYISEAQKEANNNPTKALLYAQEALALYPVKEIYDKAYKIYRDNNFYKTIFFNQNVGVDSIAFLPGNNSYITFGEVSKEDWQFDNGITRPFYFKNGKKIFAYGTRYRVWNLSGELLGELEEKDVRKLYGYPFREKKVLLDSFDSTDQSDRIKVDGGIIEVYLGKDLSRYIKAKIDKAEIAQYNFSPNRKKLITVWTDQYLRIWDLSTEELSEYKLGNSNEGDNYDDIPYAISDDGKMMLSVKSSVRLWDLTDGSMIQSSEIDLQAARVSYSKDGNRILIYNEEGAGKIWDIKAGQVTEPTITRDNFMNDPENIFKISGDFDNVIMRMDENKKWHELKGINMPSGFVSVGALPGNKCFITSSSDDTIRIWDVNKSARTGQPILKFANARPGETIYDFVFSSDGKMMLTKPSPEYGNTIRLWDIRTGSCMMTFPELESGKLAQAVFRFSPDDKQIFIAYGQLLTIWNCVPFIDEYFRRRRIGTLKKEVATERLVYFSD
jgi:WD40 repeat protein